MKTRKFKTQINGKLVTIGVSCVGGISITDERGNLTALSMLDEEDQNEVFIQIVNNQRPSMYQVVYF